MKAYLNSILFSLFFIFFWGATVISAEEHSPVNIGFIMGLTGPMGEAATLMRHGVELALEDPDTFPMKVLYEDDLGMENVEAVRGYQRLIGRGDVPLVLNWVNTTLPAIAPFAKTRRIPLLAVWDSNRGIPKLGPYLFCSGMSTELSAQNIADYIVKQRGLKKITMISLNDPWSEIVRVSFIEHFKSLGGELVTDDVVNPSDTDLRALLVKAKNKGAEGIVAPLFFDSLYALIRQAKELGFAKNIYTADAFFESDLSQIGDAAEGVYSSQTFVHDPKFADRYREKFGNVTDSAIGVSGLAYDAIKIASTALKHIHESGRKISGEEIQREFSSLIYDGVSGKANLGGESPKVEAIVIVKGKKFIPVQEIRQSS